MDDSVNWIVGDLYQDDAGLKEALLERGGLMEQIVFIILHGME